MPDAFKYVIDAAAGVALFFALLLVFVIDFFFVSGSSRPGANTLDHVTVTEDKSGRDPKRLRLAVTPTASSIIPNTTRIEKWDDMGKLLDELGEGYRYHEITEQQILQKQKKLSDYDVLFLTCAGGGDEITNQLRDFVAEGGILYASDWRFDAVKAAFPNTVVDELRGNGEKQTLNAEVTDAALRSRLGSKIELRFDMRDWKTAAFGGPSVKVLMKGDYLKMGGGRATAPLMVRFPFQKGTVIFTSFHNEKQNSRVETQLLQYLVFSLVTAGIDADVNAKLEQGGFKAQGSNLLSTPKKEQSTEPAPYENQTSDATLRFVLGFRNEGAKLRFNVKAPSGKQYTWEGKSTVILDVAHAEKGRWTYTITALDLPYANFPFTVTVGEKK